MPDARAKAYCIVYTAHEARRGHTRCMRRQRRCDLRPVFTTIPFPLPCCRCRSAVTRSYFNGQTATADFFDVPHSNGTEFSYGFFFVTTELENGNTVRQLLETSLYSVPLSASPVGRIVLHTSELNSVTEKFAPSSSPHLPTPRIP